MTEEKLSLEKAQAELVKLREENERLRELVMGLHPFAPIREREVLRERLAALAHEQWRGWMLYLFEQTTGNIAGTALIPVWAVERWKRQMNTPYAELSKEEKDSDRKEADRVLDFLCVPSAALEAPKPDLDRRVQEATALASAGLISAAADVLVPEPSESLTMSRLAMISDMAFRAVRYRPEMHEAKPAPRPEAAPEKPCAESHVRCRLGNECHVGVFWKDSRDAFRALAEKNGQRAEKAAFDAVTQRNAYEIERERAEKAEAERDEANRTIQQKDRARDSLHKVLEDCGAQRDAALALLRECNLSPQWNQRRIALLNSSAAKPEVAP